MEEVQKYLSDTDSYELVDFEDNLVGTSQGIVTDSSDIDTDFPITLDVPSDGSFEFVYPEDIHNSGLPIKATCYSDSEASLASGLASDSNETVSSDMMDYGEGSLRASSYEDYEEAQCKVAKQKLDYALPLMKIDDIVKYNVLPFLPAKSLAKCRTVSKEWDRWIGSPFLAHKQCNFFRATSGFFCEYKKNNQKQNTFITLDQSACGVPSPSLAFLPEAVTVRSSCYGLLLCSGENFYYICNPASGQWNYLPEPQWHHVDNPKAVLAYEPSALNFDASYKVICPIGLHDGVTVVLEIYDSKTEKWKIVTADCLEIGDVVSPSRGLYVNGIVYWEVFSSNGCKLLAFRVEDEIWGTLPLPFARNHDQGTFMKMHSELCYVEVNRQYGQTFVVDIYSFSLMGKTCREEISVPYSYDIGYWMGPCRVLPSANDEELVILNQNSLIFCHLSSKKVNVTKLQDVPYLDSEFFPYVNSLCTVAL